MAANWLGQMSQADKDHWEATFNEKALFDLAKNIPRDWKQLGLALGLFSDELTTIEIDNKYDGIQITAFQMLKKFRNGSDLHRTSAQTQKLISALESVGRTDMAIKIRSLLRSASADPNSSYEQGLCATVNVKTWENRARRSQLLRNPGVYQMTRYPRGYCVIISNQEVEGLQIRRGTKIDEERLKQLFTQLQFDAHSHCYQNLSAQDMKQKLQDISQRRDLINHESIVICLLSHGQKNEIYGSDGQTIPVKDLYQCFYEDNCPYLANKPKVFFIQACRNDVHSTIQHDGPVHYQHPSQPSVLTPPLYINPDALQSIHAGNPSDVLIAYATVEGYASFRDTQEGSWFIQTLVNVFQDHAKDMHLDELLKEVRCQVSSISTDSLPFGSQCPEVVTRLLRDLYFFPGIPSD